MIIVVRFILFQSSFLIETTSVARESTEKSVREGVSSAGTMVGKYASQRFSASCASYA